MNRRPLHFRTTILLTLAAALPISNPNRALAQLGQTEAQLTARYGKPVLRSADMIAEQGKVQKIGDRLSFRVDDLNLTAVMMSGHCVSLRYTRTGVLTDAQIRQLLDLNGGFTEWREQKSTAPRIFRDWKRSDEAIASWRQHTLTLSTPAYEVARDGPPGAAEREVATLSKL